MNFKLAPSLMGMDLLNVSEQIQALNRKAYMYHVDIIDWHYAKNLCFSPQFIEQLSLIASIPLDVHIMVKDLDIDIIKTVIDAGAQYISLPSEEVQKNIFKYIQLIKDSNCKLGIVVNPATPLSDLHYYIDEIDLLTIMGVTPGFASQPLVPKVLDKIKEAVMLREVNEYSYLTQIDGGCNENTLKSVYETGVDIFIVGKTLLFGKDENIDKAWDMCVETFNRLVQE